MKRLTWIDIAKGIGIVLVVLAHTRFCFTEMSWWINSFHMPLFFIVAGICYDENRYVSLWMYLKRKSIALIYPYVTLSLLVIGMMSFLYLGSDPNFASRQLVQNMLKGATGGAFWFITVLLEVELAYAVLAKVVKNPLLRVVISLIASLSGAFLIEGAFPYVLDTAIIALFFYVLGHSARRHLLKTVDASSIGGKMGLCFGVATIMDLVLLLAFFRYKATFASHDLKSPCLYFVLAILGSCSLLSFSILLDALSHRIVRSGKRWLVWTSETLRFLGRNTIVILATHNFLGLCRSTWGMNGLLSQLCEFSLLGLLLYLFSGPLQILVSPQVKHKS